VALACPTAWRAPARAMVDLMEEQVAEDGGHRLPVIDAVVAVDRDDAAKLQRAQVVTEGNQPPVDLELGRAECRCGVGQVGPTDGGAAWPGQVGEVAAIDEEDVLQRLAQRREEADPSGRERFRAQLGAGAAKPRVGLCVVARLEAELVD